MKTMTRREALRSVAGGCSAVLFGGVARAFGEPPPKRSRLGIVIYALGIHQRANWSGRHQGVAPALAFLEECHRLGAGGIQCSFGPKDAPHVLELRRRAEKYEMHVEAILNPPRDQADVERFEKDVQVAKESGAIPYDIPGVEMSHVGELCSFDTFLKKYNLTDPALQQLAVIVRGADTDRLDLAPQSPGLLAISLGLSRNISDDHEMLRHGMILYDALYTWCQSAQSERHSWETRR